jgi:hypothetical protein
MLKQGSSFDLVLAKDLRRYKPRMWRFGIYMLLGSNAMLASLEGTSWPVYRRRITDSVLIIMADSDSNTGPAF